MSPACTTYVRGAAVGVAVWVGRSVDVGCRMVTVVVWLLRASVLAAVTASGVVTTGNAWTIADSVGWRDAVVVGTGVADASGDGVGGTLVAVGGGVVGVAVGCGVGTAVAVAGASATVAVGVTTASAAMPLAAWPSAGG